MKFTFILSICSLDLFVRSLAWDSSSENSVEKLFIDQMSWWKCPIFGYYLTNQGIQ